MAQRKTDSTDLQFQRLQARLEARAAEVGVEIEPEKYSLDWYRADWLNRKQIFIEREIKIRDAFDKNKLKEFILNDAQRELLRGSIESNLDPSIENYTLKCRRLGISTFYAALYLADAIIESGHHVRIVAQDPDTLRSLMRSIKNMYDHLRPEIKPASKYNSVYDLELHDEEKGVIGSRLSVSAVVPGQEEKGRGDTFTRLHLTEIPFWRGDAETAATALCDAAKGGVISGESTAKGVGDWFHKKFTQGKRNEGGMRAHFFEWWWNPNYKVQNARFGIGADAVYLLKDSREWFELSDEEQAKAKITSYDEKFQRENNLPMQSEFFCALQIALHLTKVGEITDVEPWHCDAVARRLVWRRQEIIKKGEKKFRVEYPENEVDPFAQTGGSVFDQAYARVACEVREPEAGHRYVVALDPSMGIEGNDPAAITVIDALTGEQVYSWSGFEKQYAQAQRVCTLSDKYFGAEIVIESNMGEAAILECERLGYEHRLYRYLGVQEQRDIDEGRTSMRQALERARPGLPMTDRLKRLAIGMLEQAWRQNEFKASSQELCDEAAVFVQNGNKMEAKSGYHDDNIMVNAICWFVIETDYVGAVSYASSGQKQASARMKGF